MLEEDLTVVPVTIPRQLGSCLICRAPATGINFTVLTCAPCKAFFRRNAVKLGRIDFVCHKNGDCPITYEFRDIGNYCRLAKCFRVGMQKSLILSDSEKLARKELVEQNRMRRANSKMVQKSLVIRLSMTSYLSKKGPKPLAVSDQTLLGNVFNAYERIYARTDSGQYPSFPAIEHSVAHGFYSESEERNKMLVEYVKLIPEFNRLNIDDKIRLMRSNFGILFNFNESILTRCIHPKLVISLQNIFGISITNELIHITEKMHAYARDPILLKLFLIIWTLSIGMNKYHDDIDMDRIYDDTLAIFASQNIYVELLWRYLTSRLPSIKDAVHFFNNFVLNLLALQSSCFAVDRYMKNLENEVYQMKPLMQSMWPVAKK